MSPLRDKAPAPLDYASKGLGERQRTTSPIVVGLVVSLLFFFLAPVVLIVVVLPPMFRSFPGGDDKTAFWVCCIVWAPLVLLLLITDQLTYTVIIAGHAVTAAFYGTAAGVLAHVIRARRRRQRNA